MTVSGIRAATTSAASLAGLTPEASTPSASPKKPAHHATSLASPASQQHENQAPHKPPPVSTSTRLVPDRAATERLVRTMSLGDGGDFIGDYALGETIGQGTFGKVKLGLHLITGEKVAIKILEKKRIVEVADVERVAREIKILKRNRHVNVIQLFEVIDSPERIFLIMEFVDGGEMFEYIVAHHRIREAEAIALFQQIVDGLEYLHANDVTHRDLKPENLLLQSCASMPTGRLVKIVDFGLSNTHDNGRLLRTACGSPCYAAPEMIQGKLYNGPLADVWSLGVVLFAMVCGYLPFEDSNTNLLYKKILSADYKMPPFLSHAVQDLIRRIFETNPEKRLTTELIRQHPWFTSARPAVPRSVASTASYDDPRLRHHILNQLETVGLDPSDIEAALAQKAHNALTASFFLLYNKLLRSMKNQTPTSVSSQQQQQQQARSAGPQPMAAPATSSSSSSSKADGTPRRPEIAATRDDVVRSTGIRTTKEMVPVKAPSTTAVVPSANAAAVAYQRRRASDNTEATSSGITSHATSTQPSPRHQQSPPTTTATVRQGPPLTARSRPSSVRSGRNLVLLTNGTTQPPVTGPPQRPQPTATAVAMARPPSQGTSPRVSISNGMVALTPLFHQKRPDATVGGRRQTIIDATTSASYVASTALTTASGGQAHMRRRGTQAPASAASVDAGFLALPRPTVQTTAYAPVVPRLSARKDDDTRASMPTTSQQQRIPPQRPLAPPPSASSSVPPTTTMTPVSPAL